MHNFYKEQKLPSQRALTRRERRASPLRGRYYIESHLGCYALSLRDFLIGFLKKNKIPSLLSPPKKLLLSNCAHLGDVILMTALFAPLKKAFPSLKIGALVGSWALPVLKHHPDIDWIHSVDHWKTNRASQSNLEKWIHFRKTSSKACREIERIKYDVAIDTRFHFPNLMPLFCKVGIPMRVGFTSGGNGPLMTHPFPWMPSNRHVIEDFFSLLAPFGILSFPDLMTQLPRPHPQLFEETALGRLKRKQFLLIHMGTGNKYKEWPLDQWIALAHRLQTQGMVLCFTGKGERERVMIEKVRMHISPSESFCDLSWEAFVAFIDAASMVICSDTVAGHIAAATQTRSIVLTTGIHPIAQWRPYSSLSSIQVFPTLCSPCYLSKGCRAMSCIRSLSVDTLYAKITSEINRQL